MKHEHDWMVMENKSAPGMVYTETVCRECGETKIGGLDLQMVMDHAKNHLFLMFAEWLLLFFWFESTSHPVALVDRVYRGIRSFHEILDHAGIHAERPSFLGLPVNGGIDRAIDDIAGFKLVKKTRRWFRPAIAITFKGLARCQLIVARFSKEQISKLSGNPGT
jgi:hypothetical protein